MTDEYEEMICDTETMADVPVVIPPEDVRNLIGDFRAQEAAKFTNFGDILKIDAKTSMPSKFYHYTTAEGLMGILESGEIWATDSKYMNDYSDTIYAREMAKGILNEVASDETDNGARKLMLNVLARINKSSATPKAYVSCFCGSGDLLSQWRAYAERGGGYCIKFVIDDPTTGMSFSPYDVNFYKVIYKFKEQEYILNTIAQKYSVYYIKLRNYLKSFGNHLDTSYWILATLQMNLEAFWILSIILLSQHFHILSMRASKKKQNTAWLATTLEKYRLGLRGVSPRLILEFHVEL